MTAIKTKSGEYKAVNNLSGKEIKEHLSFLEATKKHVKERYIEKTSLIRKLDEKLDEIKTERAFLIDAMLKMDADSRIDDVQILISKYESEVQTLFNKQKNLQLQINKFKKLKEDNKSIVYVLETNQLKL